MSISLEELAKEVQKLKDIEEIKVLKARYADMCDNNHDWTQVKDLFAPDAEWVVGDPNITWGGDDSTSIGREAIEKLFRHFQTVMDGVPGKGVLGHNVIAPQITINDDGVTATGKWHLFGPFRLFDPLAENGKKSVLEQGKYMDEYVKIDEDGNLDPNGKWYYKRLCFWDTLWASPAAGWDDNVLQE